MKITTMLDLPIANINDAVCFIDFGTTPTLRIGTNILPQNPTFDIHPRKGLLKAGRRGTAKVRIA